MRDCRLMGGFTLLELTVVLLALGALAAVIVPRLNTDTSAAAVNGTARALSSAINIHAALSHQADLSACGGLAYSFGEGAVCIQADPGSAPVEPVGFTGFGARNSTKLWRVLLDGRPIETSADDLDGSGWVATRASGCDRDSTFTYCWDYYSAPDNRVATIRYNNADQAGIEVISHDG